MLVAAVANRCLNVDAIGITDNFFDMGGNFAAGDAASLARLKPLLGQRLPLVDIFSAPTVCNQMATRFRKHVIGIFGGSTQCTGNPAGQVPVNPPLFFGS